MNRLVLWYSKILIETAVSSCLNHVTDTKQAYAYNEIKYITITNGLCQD